MIYFKQKGNLIEKYEVSFDKEKVEALKERIIYECSFIEHRVFVSDYGAGYKDYRLVRNLTKVKVGEKDYFEETRTIYRYTYDEYIPPKLVDYINSFINGSSTSLNLILNYDFSGDMSIDERINNSTEEFNLIPVDNIYEKKKQLEKIDSLLKAKIINENQKDIKPYYQELMSLIHFELVDSITYEEINRFESFFEEEIFDKKNVRIRK